MKNKAVYGIRISVKEAFFAYKKTQAGVSWQVADQDLKKLRRADLVEILCRQREQLDELTERNRLLQARAERAEARINQYTAIQQELVNRKAEDAALRNEMRRVLQSFDTVKAALAHCGESDQRIQSAEQEAEAIRQQAQAQAQAMLDEAQKELAQRQAEFTRQCQEMVRGQEMLRRLMGNG